MPSATRTNAPNGTSFVTLPGATWPIAWVRAKTCHGSSCVALSDSETRSRSRSTSRDLDGDLLADLDDLAGVLDVLPRELGDVDETVDAAEVDERTEVDDRRDDALADLALVEVREERRTRLGLRLLEQRAAREHHVVAVLVELEDLRLDLLAEVRREVADAAQLDERSREEAAEADVDDQSALDDLDDRTGDDAIGSP